VEKKVCQERTKRHTERQRRYKCGKSFLNNKEKLKREKELALEVKACDLVTSLKQPDIEQVKKAVECWDFKTNLVKQGQSQILNDITMNLSKVISDPGDIALLFRKVGKPDKKLPQFKSHDKYLPALDRKVRSFIRCATKKECLAPVYDKNARVTCSPEEARRKMERMYQRLGFADAKERALKGLEESKRGKGITE